MKKLLFLVGITAAMATGAPARGQYIYMDVYGDGVCSSSDILTSSVTTVDIYLDTNHDAAGREVTCSDGTNPLNIGSYSLLFEVLDKQGSAQLTGWTNGMSGYTEVSSFTVAGRRAGVGFTGSEFLPPGRYKLGHLSVVVTGVPSLFFLSQDADPGIPTPVTGFGSQCDASAYPNTVTLGVDFSDNCNVYASFDAVEATTWGKIKQVYR